MTQIDENTDRIFRVLHYHYTRPYTNTMDALEAAAKELSSQYLPRTITRDELEKLADVIQLSATQRAMNGDCRYDKIINDELATLGITVEERKDMGNDAGR